MSVKFETKYEMDDGTVLTGDPIHALVELRYAVHAYLTAPTGARGKTKRESDVLKAAMEVDIAFGLREHIPEKDSYAIARDEEYRAKVAEHAAKKEDK